MTAPRRAAFALAGSLLLVPLAAAGGASARAAAVPTKLTAPSISGSPVQGKVLSASTGSWTGRPTRYTYAWLDCDPAGASCVKIAGATVSTYGLAASDVGHRMRVAVRAWNASGASSAARSASTAVVTAAAPSSDVSAPTAPTGLTVYAAGATQMTLSWTRSTDNVGVTGYTAYRNGSAAGSATGTSYAFAGLGCGASYTLGVEAYDAAGNRSARESLAASTAACAPPSNTAAPSVAGSAQVGQVLAASTGSWSGTAPMAYSYQWQDCDSAGAGCAAIAGATGGSYALAGGDEGKTVRVKVTASNSAGAAAASSAQTAVVQAAPAGGGGLSGLHVSGNKLVNGGGAVVRLHGVNYSGPEYACIQGWGIFDGPSDDAAVTAMAAWRSNIVRIPLNEDCWLGINGVPAAYAGANYRNAIVAFVGLLHKHGMYAELSLIWGAPSTYQATYQPGAPDADHSPAFWSSLAATFKDDANVILAPWGETITGWTCFMQTGCKDQATYGPSNQGYQTAPMQQAVTLMRQAGYNGPIAIPCIDYANGCANLDGSSWLLSHPTDPANQLLAEAHVYGKNTCDNASCLDTTMGPLAAQVPLLFGETGETWDDSECGSGYISTFMNWADAHGVGYEAWTWDTWGTCLSLITKFDGTPNSNGYATWVKSHYATLP